jgi:hypothetical protein
MKKTECIHLFAGEAPRRVGVKVEQTGIDKFTVTYGLWVKKGLNYGAAAKEFGECVFHHLACNSLLDNREKGER